eukprot:TRINITY_DN812_c0_g1_i6.p1 TRINITY_DN812_c0_g1~~TRINITY_DN812_c0_g1_i6.p1  ORF type:complete len:1229 (-),score=264.06 TRINITY_DN812_c0_g1_i6:40-3726(-)
MAVAAFDGEFSFSQESVARLGDRAGTSKLTEEQQKQLKQSAAFQAQKRVDELVKEYSEARDKKRALLDQAFTPEDADFKTPKAYDYDRSMNYYEVLGIEEYAPLDEVKRAYKRLSLVYHPDKTKGMTDEQQQDYEMIFISVKNANLVLGHQATRRQYDKDRDYDLAKAEVSGVKVQTSQHVDLTEVLKRINEMQRPPGKVVEVALQCELEEFLYGVHKVIHRPRTVKDFYRGLLKQDHSYRLHIPPGSPEPLDFTFKEQGDYNSETKPDSIRFSVTSRAHPVLQRQGADLVLREEVDLGAGSLAKAHVAARASSIKGRELLIWGLNPFSSSSRSPSSASSSAQLHVAVLGEGISPEGHLRFRCRLSGFPPARQFSKQDAREFLKDLASAQEAWAKQPDKRESLWSRLGVAAAAHGVAQDSEVIREGVRAALRALPGEWALAAKAVAILTGGSSRPRRKAFLKRHGLATQAVLDTCGSDTEDEAADQNALRHNRRLQGVHHSRGGLCDSPVLLRAKERSRGSMQACEVELRPLGQAVALFTQPHCSLTFYSNLHQITPSKTGATRPMFAVCLSSPACAEQEANAESQWQQLRSRLVPLLERTFLLLLREAREHLPAQLSEMPWRVATDTPAAPQTPWRRLGRESFRNGDFWLASTYFSRCLDEAPETEDHAIALSNRAACYAKVGHCEASLADARTARDLRPAWGRAWARIGAAASQLGEEHREEALQACRRAVELQPSAENIKALSSVAEAAASSLTDEQRAKAAEAERVAGNAAFGSASNGHGQAVAHYTVAIAFAPAPMPLDEAEVLSRTERTLQEAVDSRIGAEEKFREAERRFREATSSEAVCSVAVLFANRAAALCHLKCWDDAVEDAQLAVKLRRDWAKARCRLAVALLGARRTEEAYTQLAWAVAFDSGCATARSGLEACISMIPSWRSRAARHRSERFNRDCCWPRAKTRVWAVSDLHFDNKSNEEWCHGIDDVQFQDDVLIVAGNLADTLHTAIRALKVLRAKFRRVFFTPGNNDLSLNASEVRTARFPDSMAKLLALLAACDELDVDVFPAAICQDVCVLPLFSWYNSEFDKKSRPDPNHGHDANCVWPLDSQSQLWKWMLKLNEEHLRMPSRSVVLSFSHFLPLAALPFDSTGKKAQAMGCEEIEDQLRLARSAAHVYGHSTVRTSQVHGGVMFINQALGIESEPEEEPAKPLLIFDGSNGLVFSEGSSRVSERRRD